MEPLCTVMLVVLSLCSPPAAPPGTYPQVHVTRVSPSSDLLGRQMAVAPVTMPGSTSSDSASPGSPWGDPHRLAFCGKDAIQRTLDGGMTWSRVPTDGVVALAAGTEMPLASRSGASPACQSIVLDPRDPDTFYAVFQAVKAPQDAPPPWFAAGYVTRDAGQSWQPAPIPTGQDGLRFGGFVADESSIEALFSPVPAGPTTEAVPPVVMATADAAQSWQPAPFACPASGACIRWGAPPTGVGSCTMHGYGQPLLVSADGGQSWTSPEGARTANACHPNELVVVSDRDVLLLAPGPDELEGGDPAPVRVSHDGGRTFAAQALPEGPATSELFELYLLPDQRLLARVSGQIPGPGWSWQILAPSPDQPAESQPAASSWCAVPVNQLPWSGAPLRLAGDRLWWITPPGQPASLALADLHCEAPGTSAPSRNGP
jgi:hypothetical protein